MNRILIPVDFSIASGNALKYAALLAEELNKQLTLLHCYPKKEFSRPYTFKNKSYQEGIIEKLRHFTEDYLGDDHPRMRFLAKAGGMVDTVAMLSKGYELVVLSSSHFNTKLERWMGSRSSYIASAAHCPVLIISRSTQFRPWNTIWHIRRNESESDLLETGLKHLHIKPDQVICKTLNQTTFTSALWQSIVAYENTHTAALEKKVFEASQNEKLDLMVFVSQEKSAFQKFINDDAIHLMFQFDIPVLVVQSN